MALLSLHTRFTFHFSLTRAARPLIALVLFLLVASALCGCRNTRSLTTTADSTAISVSQSQLSHHMRWDSMLHAITLSADTLDIWLSTYPPATAPDTARPCPLAPYREDGASATLLPHSNAATLLHIRAVSMKAQRIAQQTTHVTDSTATTVHTDSTTVRRRSATRTKTISPLRVLHATLWLVLLLLLVTAAAIWYRRRK